MKIIKENSEMHLKHEPKIGIFWIYKEEILAGMKSLRVIRAVCGMKDTDFEHYRLWSEFQKARHELRCFEYEDIPRGRIVYSEKENAFILYLGKEMAGNKGIVEKIVSRFDLKNLNVRVCTDEHYGIILKNRNEE